MMMVSLVRGVGTELVVRATLLYINVYKCTYKIKSLTNKKVKYIMHVYMYMYVCLTGYVYVYIYMYKCVYILNIKGN